MKKIISTSICLLVFVLGLTASTVQVRADLIVPGRDKAPEQQPIIINNNDVVPAEPAITDEMRPNTNKVYDKVAEYNEQNIYGIAVAVIVVISLAFLITIRRKR